MLVQIFFLRGKSPTNMPFGLIHIQYFSRFCCQRRIHLNKSLGYILMYSALTYPKSLGCLSDRGIAFDDIIGDADGTLFNIIFQRNTPQEYFLPLYEVFLEGMTNQLILFPIYHAHFLVNTSDSLTGTSMQILMPELERGNHIGSFHVPG